MIRALPVRNPGELVILNWRAKARIPLWFKAIMAAVTTSREAA